jgi:transcriptional regulator with XRE-family HTH domain
METLGERLRHAMAVRGVTKQMAFAVELGVDESAVSRWRRGAGLSIVHAARVCEVLDISLDWLILGRGDMDLHRSQPAERAAPSRLAAVIERLPETVADALTQLVLTVQAELDLDRP